MGCTGSKLAGDDFSNIDAAALSSTTRAPGRSANSNLAPSPSYNTSKKDSQSSSFGSHAYTGTLPFTPSKSKNAKPEKEGLFETSIADLGLRAATRTLTPDGAEPTPKPKPMMVEYMEGAPGSERVGGAGGERRVLRTDEDRKLPDPVTGKKPGLYARYTNKRLGVGEERDPVTGRGLLTGMTKEETIAYVQRTRGSGMPGDKHKQWIGGYAGLGML